MKHATGLWISLIVSLLVIGCAATIWYLSATTEFTRKQVAPTPATKPVVKPAAKPKPATPRPGITQ